MAGPRAAGAGPRVLMIAGEVSGDRQAALLARALLARRPDLSIAGVGGREMAAAGVDVLIESLEWGVIGYAETYLRLPIFALRFWELVRLIGRHRPDLLVLVDFPGMNRELVRHFSGRVPMVYFFPPQTALRRGASAARMARAAVRLLAVLPFEAEAYRRAGADVVYIGHPAVDALRAPSPSPAELRGEWGISGGLMAGLLPGSRRQEICRLLPPMLQAAREIGAAHPVSWVLPVASPFLQGEVEHLVSQSRAPVRVIRGRALDVMRAADVVVLASGTASVEAACAGVPMVVVYRVSRMTDWIARRFVLTEDFERFGFSLPNIVLQRRLVPELLNEDVTPSRIRAEAEPLLVDAAVRSRMRGDLAEVARRLGPPGVLPRAAEETLRVLDSRGQVTLP